MDFKKIKPNDVLGFLDELVAKIPESISSLLTKVMIGILVLSIIYAAYYGYKRGYGSARQEGQELAKDTKSLFLEDIEREYNRKRKNIRMPSAESLISDEIYKTPKQYEPYGRNTDSGAIVAPEDSLLENDKSIRSYKKKGDTSPLAELNDVPPSQETPIPYGTENQNQDLKPKRRLELKDNFDNPLTNSDNRDLNSVLDRVNTDSSLDKKILTKKESNKRRKDSETSPSNEPEPLKKDTGKLTLPDKTQKQEKKGRLIPLDGNE
jgi:hypothetical protein